MESAVASWLNTAFSGYDHAILSLMHTLATWLGFVLTPLMKIVTLLGEKGLVFFLLALIFMLFAEKRDLGVCIFGAVCCGALITNIILKDNVARVRPFEFSGEYQQWWDFVGAPAEDGFSFPSGHVTAAAAGMTAICMMRGRRFVVPSVIIVLVMGISRNYLMAHFPSDVLFAVFIGVFSGVVACFITRVIFSFLRGRRDLALCELVLDFDIGEVLPFKLPGFLQSFFYSESPEKAPEKKQRSERGVKESKRMTLPRVNSPKRGSGEQPTGRHSEPEGAKSAKSSRSGSGYRGKHEL